MSVLPAHCVRYSLFVILSSQPIAVLKKARRSISDGYNSVISSADLYNIKKG